MNNTVPSLGFVHASCTIFAGMKLKEPGPSSTRFPAESMTNVPLTIVCVSFALCQCLETFGKDSFPPHGVVLHEHRRGGISRATIIVL